MKEGDELHIHQADLKRVEHVSVLGRGKDNALSKKSSQQKHPKTRMVADSVYQQNGRKNHPSEHGRWYGAEDQSVACNMQEKLKHEQKITVAQATMGDASSLSGRIKIAKKLASE
jgi:hypothetical protein